MSRPNVWCSRVIVPAVVLVLACQPCLAQGAPGDWTNVQNLPADSAISVKTKGGTKYHGELVNVTTDSLAIDSDEPGFPGRTVRRREFRREDVHEIRLAKPWASLAAGAAIGAGAGAGIGVALDSTAKSHEYRGVLALLLGGLGAGIGAAIAHHHPFVKGNRVYLGR